jgi:hypothetical protein
MDERRRRLAGALLLALIASCPSPALADDRFIEGYATAVLERDLGLRPLAVEMREGLLVVHLDSLRGASASRVRAALEEIRGVGQVEIRRVSHSAATSGEGANPPVVVDVEESEFPGPGQDRGFEVFPRRELFEPLLADVRWPNFSASYQWYLDDRELTHVGSANFAESFALLAGDLGDASRWELGLHAGVFSIFDLDVRSNDLINSDFLVGPTLAIRSGQVTGLLRLFHQSSHLGDEFLLRNRARRVNLSYEAVDALVSLDLHPSVRVYAGGGYIFRDEPDLHPLSAQAGVEIESPWSAFSGIVRPVVASDLRWAEQDDWNLDISVRAGLLLENPRLSKLRLRALFEYFQGHSPNGQFFERQIEYAGVGLHLDL